MAFEADTLYMLFIYSKVVHVVSQPEGEAKAQSRNASASGIHRDAFQWGEKRFFSQGRKM